MTYLINNHLKPPNHEKLLTILLHILLHPVWGYAQLPIPLLPMAETIPQIFDSPSIAGFCARLVFPYGVLYDRVLP
ncbi:MAG: hypothetical protein IPH02_16830 [Sphingobacteriales bacterium]|nr:hypothetical protein [Sphingobacteriales bacterium]